MSNLARSELQVIKAPRKVLAVIAGVEHELGHTSGGIKWTVKVDSYDVDSDQAGNIDTMMKVCGSEIETPLLQWSKEIIALILPNAIRTVNGSDDTVEFGTNVGVSLRSLAIPIILRPEDKTASDKSDDIYHYLMAPMDGFNFSFSGEASKEVISVKWRSFPHATKGNTKNLFFLGPAIA